MRQMCHVAWMGYVMRHEMTHSRDMTHDTWHDASESFTRDMTHSCDMPHDIWHDASHSFTRDMTHSRDVTRSRDMTHSHDMTHSCMHDAFTHHIHTYSHMNESCHVNESCQSKIFVNTKHFCTSIWRHLFIHTPHLRTHLHITNRSRRRSDLEYLDLQIRQFSCLFFWMTGTPIFFRENLFEI